MKPEEQEKYLEKFLVNHVKQRGGMCFKLPALHHAGIPDRICLMPKGRVYFVEVKTAGKQPTKLQKSVHRKLLALGHRVIIMDSLFGVKDIR